MNLKRIVYSLALALSLLAAGCVLWMALDLNSQGEYFDTEFGIKWKEIALLFFAIFAWALGIFGAIGWVILHVARRWR